MKTVFSLCIQSIFLFGNRLTVPRLTRWPVRLPGALSRPLLAVHTTYSRRFLSDNKDATTAASFPPFDDDEISIPDPPTTCCMSGCAHCVWIEYAKELAAIYKDGGQAAEKVMRTIEDPSLKIFLSLELKEALKDSE